MCEEIVDLESELEKDKEAWDDIQEFQSYGLEDLKGLMDGLSPEEVGNKDFLWCEAKFYFLKGTTLAGLFRPECFEGRSPYGFYLVALKERLAEGGIEVSF